MDIDTLRGLEQLNQLSLTDEQEQRALAFFSARENDLDVIASIDTSNVERMVYVREMQNVLRDDVVIKNFTAEELQQGAPETMDGYWQVPRLVM